MKLPAFDYLAPETVEQAVALLSRWNGRAKAIAGGQSLLPTMAFRLAAPSALVDLRKIEGLRRIQVDGTGVRLGALVRWRDIEDSTELKSANPLLVEAIGHVAHYQIRNRGTVGGSLAHADPAAEMPGIAVTCDGTMTIAGSAGMRTVEARDFFLGPLATALSDDELIVEVALPPWRPGRRFAFEEFAKRRGDFALAGIAAYYDVDPEGRAFNVHIGVIGACDRPHRVAPAEAELEGRRTSTEAITAAARAAAAAVEPPEDLHGSARYRRALVEVLAERALARASGNRNEAS